MREGLVPTGLRYSREREEGKGEEEGRERENS